jgi:hypothetical protein
MRPGRLAPPSSGAQAGTPIRKQERTLALEQARVIGNID